MKKISLKIITVIIIGIFLLNSNIVIAANEITQMQNEKNDTQSKIDETEKKKEEVTQQKNETIEQVEELSTKISEYESQIEELDSKIDELNNKIKETEQNLENAQKDYEKREEALKKRMIAIYEAGETSYLDFILSSNSLSDFLSKYYVASEIANRDKELLEQIEAQKKEIEASKLSLENSKKELDTTKASKQQVSTELQNSKKEKTQYVSQLSAEEKELQEQIDELAEYNKTLDAKIKQKQAQIQEEIRKAQEEQKKQNNSNNSSGSGSSSNGSSSSGGAVSSVGFMCPVPSHPTITTGLYYSSGAYHGAVDFGSGGINGQPIFAVAAGTVIISTRLNGSYGNYIIIKHDNGLYTLYAHGQDGSRTVSTGDRVSQGQQIMRVGSTGNSTGPHLHFEVRTSPGGYSNRVDPRRYLP